MEERPLMKKIDAKRTFTIEENGTKREGAVGINGILMIFITYQSENLEWS